MVFEYSSWSWAGGEITKRLRPVNYAGTEPIGFTLTIRLHTRGCVIITDLNLNLQNLNIIQQHQFVAQFFHFSIQQTFDTIILSSNTNPDLLMRRFILQNIFKQNSTQVIRIKIHTQEAPDHTDDSLFQTSSVCSISPADLGHLNTEFNKIQSVLNSRKIFNISNLN